VNPHLDRAAVQFHEASGERQPDAEPAERPIAVRLQLLVAVHE